jgi:hypothetical protein
MLFSVMSASLMTVLYPCGSLPLVAVQLETARLVDFKIGIDGMDCSNALTAFVNSFGVGFACNAIF